ncbi:Xylanase inhibitor, N-terminal, partial [Sesbania bispinosa]
DYRSLVLARLSRDSARVNWILSKLQLVNESELRPEGLSAPLISGLSQGAAEYFMRIGVGQPVQPFYMIPDTGSDVNWLQCKPCVRCYNQSDPIFDPSRSSSYAKVTCESKQCKELGTESCRDHECEYEVTVPTVSFDMSDGQSWRLPVLGYMIPVDDKATFCFAFAPSSFPLSIIGNVQQQGTRVTFDLAKFCRRFLTPQLRLDVYCVV